MIADYDLVEIELNDDEDCEPTYNGFVTTGEGTLKVTDRRGNTFVITNIAGAFTCPICVTRFHKTGSTVRVFVLDNPVPQYPVFGGGGGNHVRAIKVLPRVEGASK